MSSSRRAISATTCRDQGRHEEKRLDRLRSDAFRNKYQLNKDEMSQWVETSRNRLVRPTALDLRGNAKPKKMRPRLALLRFYMQIWKIWASQIWADLPEMEEVD